MQTIMIVCKGHRNIAGAQMYLKQIAPLFPKEAFVLHFALHRNDGLKFVEEISEKSRTAIVDYDWRHLPFLRAFAAGLKIFRTLKPDLVLFNSPEDRILAPVWAAFVAGVRRRVMVVHWAQSPDELPLFSRKRWAGWPVPSRYAIRTRLIRAIAYRTLNALIFVSQITRDAYVKLYKVPASRCHRIYNGVDTSAYHRPQLREEMRRQLGLSPETCLLLATGNLTEVKGHAYLVAAVQRLVSRGLAVKCFIAGQGELASDLEKQVVQMQLHDHVGLLGYREDIPALLSATDIFCMPSLNEAFGYSLVEAMAAGVPIVASAVGGIPEVVSHGSEGLLVPPADAEALCVAIETLWRQPELRAAMGQRSLDRATRDFDLSIMRGRTKHLFNSLLPMNGNDDRFVSPNC